MEKSVNQKLCILFSTRSEFHDNAMVKYDWTFLFHGKKCEKIMHFVFNTIFYNNVKYYFLFPSSKLNVADLISHII